MDDMRRTGLQAFIFALRQELSVHQIKKGVQTNCEISDELSSYPDEGIQTRAMVIGYLKGFAADASNPAALNEF